MIILDKKELNEEQIDAIINPDNVMLIACPGSGKTRTLTYKIAFELSKITDLKTYVIAITFTNRAADEIKERIELLGIHTKQLWIGTIHSFCLEWILRPYSLYLPRFKNGFRVISSNDSEDIISDLCNKFNQKNNLQKKAKITYRDCGFNASIDDITTKPKFKITSLDSSKKKSIESILQKYFRIQKINNQLDFEQILFFSLELLRKNTIINSILSRLFPYILVDEFQDTKEIQYHVISSILKSKAQTTKLFIVGDPNQSIYQTLGGYPIGKTELEKLCGLSIKELELSKNYRSSKKIIEFYSYFRTTNNKNVASNLKVVDYNSIISLNTTVTKDDLIDEIARLIEININKYGVSQNEICVLAPQWVHISSITKKLILKLPDYSFDGVGAAPFSRDIENFWFKLSRLVLTAPSPKTYIKRLRWSSDIISELNNAGIDISELSKKGFLKLCNSIELDETDGLKYLEKFFDILFAELSINISVFPTLVEHHKAFFESSKKRIQRLRKDGLDFITDTESFRKVFEQSKGITVSTYHGIKGAEYDTVIAFALLQDYIPYLYDKKGVENSKKLLYVIASRARKNLHLIAENKRFKVYGKPPPEYKTTQHLINYKYPYSPI